MKKIKEVRLDTMVVYTDGIMSKEERVGEGWCSEGGGSKGSVGLGWLASLGWRSNRIKKGSENITSELEGPATHRLYCSYQKGREERKA